jgi:Fe-S cluster biogenesis protein NfuA
MMPQTMFKEWSKMNETLKEKVQKAIAEIRPNLQADGGDIELVDVEDGIVKVRLKGACAGCPMSSMTVQWGVENFLKKKIPEVAKVEAI